MAHYVEIHVVSKALTEGNKVISFTGDKITNNNSERITQIVRFNECGALRKFFGVTDDWNCDYFVIDKEEARYLIEDLLKIIDKDEDPQIAMLIKGLWIIINDQREGNGYLISWDD